MTFPSLGAWRHGDQLRNEQECAELEIKKKKERKKFVCETAAGGGWRASTLDDWNIFTESSVFIVHHLFFPPRIPVPLEPRLGRSGTPGPPATAGKGAEDLAVNHGVWRRQGGGGGGDGWRLLRNKFLLSSGRHAGGRSVCTGAETVRRWVLFFCFKLLFFWIPSSALLTGGLIRKCPLWLRFNFWRVNRA